MAPIMMRWAKRVFGPKYTTPKTEAVRCSEHASVTKTEQRPSLHKSKRRYRSLFTELSEPSDVISSTSLDVDCYLKGTISTAKVNDALSFHEVRSSMNPIFHAPARHESKPDVEHTSRDSRTATMPSCSSDGVNQLGVKQNNVPEDCNNGDTISLNRFISLNDVTANINIEECNASKEPTDKQQYTMTLAELQDDNILCICESLPKDDSLAAFKSTCWRYHLLLEDSSIWNCTHIAVHLRLHKGLLTRALTNSIRLRQIDLSECVQASDELLYYVIICQPGIREVNLTGCVLISDKAMAVMQHCLSQLTHLSISRCRLVTCHALVKLVRRHRSTLVHLDISNSLGLLTDRYRIAEIANQLPELRSLGINWSNRYERTLVLASDLTKIASMCPRLTHLNGCSTHIHARTMDAIANHCQSLRYMSLANCFIRYADFARFGQRLSQLEHLDISGCNSLQEAGLVPSYHQLYRLRHLNVSNCFYLRNGTVQDILSKLYNLRELFMRNCFKVTELGIELAFTHPCLGVLDVSGTSVSRAYVHARMSAERILYVISDNCPPRSNGDGIMWS